MYKEHPTFEPPENDDAKVWRYMDLTKFVWMLDKQCLYFCRADVLKRQDPYEGSLLPSELLKSVPVPVAQNFTAGITSSGPPVTVNCWHLSDYESAAMWKLYAGENKGIAIQSTFGRMKRSFEGFADNVYIGEITYMDYRAQTYPGCGDKFKGFLTKRKSFEHEKELRVLIWETSKLTKRTDDGSVLANVNLKELIENIYISPFSPVWNRDTVQAIVKKFGLGIQVQQSELDREPLY
jgi:hypothetical protein